LCNKHISNCNADFVSGINVGNLHCCGCQRLRLQPLVMYSGVVDTQIYKNNMFTSLFMHMSPKWLGFTNVNGCTSVVHILVVEKLFFFFKTINVINYLKKTIYIYKKNDPQCVSHWKPKTQNWDIRRGKDKAKNLKVKNNF
jgi:hypothetical protein